MENISQYENIWKTREFISYAQKKDSPSIKHDISLPISKIPKFIEEAEISIKKILFLSRCKKAYNDYH